MVVQGQVSRHRADFRRSVFAHALLIGDGPCRDVIILNYSPRGLHLIDSSENRVGRRVTIELTTGHRLPVVVASVDGSQAVVRFVGAIAPGHPALQALDDAARQHKQHYLEAHRTDTESSV